MESGTKDDSIEKFRGFHIDDDGDDEVQEIIVDEDDDEDDEDDDEDEQQPVTLGFLEEKEYDWSLLRQSFPSKAGGVPAWLDPVNLPSGRSSACDICGEPLQFVLQVYAPISEKESAFHRTLFVFMCQSMTCLLRDQHEQWKRYPEKASRSVKVFCCQLPHLNPFYPSAPPRYDGTDKPSGTGAKLCNWCGTWKGDKVCSSCRKVHYCSQKHQVTDWRLAHRIDCQRLSLSSQSSDSCSSNGGTTSSEIQKVASNTLWPEYEIRNVDESEYDTEMMEDNGHASSLITSNRVDDTMNSLLQKFEGDSDKKSWASFQQRIVKAPEQVVRYCRDAGAKPLWPMSSGRPSQADIPKCRYCNGAMIFEFQILPQLLYYFNVKNDADSLDWATIVVYTCESSCEASVAYKEEFAWVQLYSPSASVP
ncbi:hypothetical protein HS088_TW08G00715 [Tripterygium wilfordii]|uniref:MYND-type domain-containing protein n=1 Tax=Tripterygium wilfordii TaxID=458696 RepID=A0A7J7DCS7_TRIWF|nr:programmed cell death protein 2 [Tripterygium wilfordii]KAF5744121.1 hypothetical protein HS088_TW08G00715 [Tripterygium wilfordii]